MRTNSPDAADELEFVRDMILNCASYVQAVNAMESFRLVGRAHDGAEYRQKMFDLDSRRSAYHNGLITSVNLVNNLCARYGLEKAYSGSSERAEYGDYAIRLTSEIFEGRVR